MTLLHSKNSKTVAALVFFTTVLIAILLTTNSLTDNTQVQALVTQLGYAGVGILGFLAGLNPFIPIPAAAFTPLFLAAGLHIPLVILAIAFGTLLADCIGFLLGKAAREIVQRKHPKLFTWSTKIAQKHYLITLGFVLLYAAFVPFPNEAILIPLALAGIPLRQLLLPLILGNIVHHTVLVLGVAEISSRVFS